MTTMLPLYLQTAFGYHLTLLVHPPGRMWIPSILNIMGPEAWRISKMTSIKSAGLVLEREFLGPPAQCLRSRLSTDPESGSLGQRREEVKSCLASALGQFFCTEMSAGSKQSKQAAPMGRGSASDGPAPGGHRSSGSAESRQQDGALLVK